MSILFNTHYQRSYEFLHRGTTTTFDLYPGKGVLLFSALDTHEELLLAEHLESLGVPTAMLPMPLAPDLIHIAIGEKQKLTIQGHNIPLKRVGAVWFLCSMDRPKPPGVHPAEHEFDLNEWRTTLWHLRMAISAQWVNNPGAVGISRLAALQCAQVIGLQVPRTIVTNDPGVAKEFSLEVGPCVIKRVGHVFPALNEGDIFGIFTKRLSAENLKDEKFASSPVLIQEEIIKRLEYRVYIIGDEVVAFRLHVGEVLDWREIGAFAVKKEHIILSEETTQRLRKLVQTFGLKYAAIDLIENMQGDLFFLEINPNGTFEFCNYLVKPSLSERICNLLINGFKQSK